MSAPGDLHPAPLTRRAFLGRIAALGAAGAGTSALLAACGGGEGGGPEVIESASCEGYNGLTPADRQLRASLNYVDQSPAPEQHCNNCRFFRAPEVMPGGRCGGCQLFQGPISPGGWCRSWAAATPPAT